MAIARGAHGDRRRSIARLVQDRLLARLSIAFGVVALLLAAIGLYGVLSYGVARRTNEIGIRKALGAQHGTVIAMILRETGWLLALGLVAGSALSAAALRLITSRLYGLSATDPVDVRDGASCCWRSSRRSRHGCPRGAPRASIRWWRCARSEGSLAPSAKVFSAHQVLGDLGDTRNQDGLPIRRGADAGRCAG